MAGCSPVDAFYEEICIDQELVPPNLDLPWRTLEPATVQLGFLAALETSEHLPKRISPELWFQPRAASSTGRASGF